MSDRIADEAVSEVRDDDGGLGDVLACDMTLPRHAVLLVR
jgi:hypothetical protein